MPNFNHPSDKVGIPDTISGEGLAIGFEHGSYFPARDARLADFTLKVTEMMDASVTENEFERAVANTVEQKVKHAHQIVRRGITTPGTPTWILGFETTDGSKPGGKIENAFGDYTTHLAIVSFLGQLGLTDSYFRGSEIIPVINRYRLHLSQSLEKWQEKSWAVSIGYIPKHAIRTRGFVFLTYEFRYGEEFGGHKYGLVGYQHLKRPFTNQQLADRNLT